MNLIKIPFIALEVLLVFNLIIVVHELGHFLAAKWRGLVIEKFAIWFGKPLWKKTINGIEYSLGTIPAGGFVALPQMATMEAVEGQSKLASESLPKASALDKIIVAFAGPLFSFLLAVVLATLVWVTGRPVSEADATTVIGFVQPDSPASKAGLEIGDKILSVDGYAVNQFGGMGGESVSWRIIRSEGDTVPVTVERNVNGVTETKTLYPAPKIEPTKPWMRKAFREIGIMPAQRPMVAQVDPDSPAEKAGLKPSDVITQIDGRPAYTLEAMADYVKDHPEPSYTLDVEREGKTVQLSFTPAGAQVHEVLDDSPAAAAGIQKGDKITAIDGKPMPDGLAISDYVRNHGIRPISFTVVHEGVAHNLTITPRMAEGEKKPLIGLIWEDEFGIAEDAIGKFQIVHPSPLNQIRSGVMTVVDTVGAIASKKSDVKLQQLAGPVMIMRLYYMLFQSPEGWRLALWLSVVFNVNLALINLLPMPVLDGGHIMLAIIEAIRRRPVNVRLMEVVQTSCAALIIGFMLYITFFDVQDTSWIQQLLRIHPDQVQFDSKGASPAPSQR